ncbi:hypothetical protein F2Q69_00054248 [Brassica cretica]|uniref:Uncharacterized protein n=1 Tax=Brassica cretica TaxID=69181 RepID=A0A8S9N3P7_BRACR|nr:hypothetical protein F2Q69_00054248 [Brassica cretica]
MLWSLLGSNGSAHDSVMCSYENGFSGFAVKLSKLSEIVHVTPDCLYELTNTWTWYCFGFPAANQKNVLNDTNVSISNKYSDIPGMWLESEVFKTMGSDRYHNAGKEVVNHESISTPVTAKS